MEIINNNSKAPKNVSLILGFFDGIHLGHRNVIEQAPEKFKKVIVTFSKSPAEFFTQNFNYIYPREISYSIAEELGIDYIFEYDFENIMELTAEEYLCNLVRNFTPKYIISGYNHTFGKNKLGNTDFLYNMQTKYHYKYIYTPEFKNNDTTISSTKIKELLNKGKIKEANQFLGENFKIKSKVIKGVQLGRKLGFPTANMDYPKNIVRLPYGVFSAKIFNKPAILNWGIKPTVDGKKEVLELHIINSNIDLYGKEISFEIIDKIRDERKFKNLEELKTQINKDIKLCLES